VTPDFLTGRFTLPPQFTPDWFTNSSARDAVYQPDISGWERLRPSDCWNAYSSRFITARRNLIAVSPQQGKRAAILKVGIRIMNDRNQSMSFLCAPACPSGGSTPTDFPMVDYCLSEPWPEKCQFDLSPPLMIAVIVCNIVKVICLGVVLWQHRFDTLITTGDSIVSFLDNPDPTTKNRCLISRNDVVAAKSIPSDKPRTYQPSQSRWRDAVSKKRWWTCYLMYVYLVPPFKHISHLTLTSSTSVLAISTALFFVGRQSIPGYSLAYMWHLGFGTAVPEALVYTISSGLLGNVLIANLPQLILSFFLCHVQRPLHQHGRR
jgi:hypothetical protein